MTTTTLEHKSTETTEEAKARPYRGVGEKMNFSKNYLLR